MLDAACYGFYDNESYQGRLLTSDPRTLNPDYFSITPL